MNLKCLMNNELEVNYPCSPSCALFGDCVTAFEAQKKSRVITNADYIRSMTDEELAEFLCDATYKENEQGYPIMRTANKVWWHKWLKQPYREEGQNE